MEIAAPTPDDDTRRNRQTRGGERYLTRFPDLNGNSATY
jgi:hypothetical protein